MERSDMRNGIVYVSPDEAYERLELLTGLKRPQVQQAIRAGQYPVKSVPGGGRLIGIPANAPPTMRNQLAAERERRLGLQQAHDALVAQVGELEKEVSDRTISESNMTEVVRTLRDQLVDEIDYRAYLAVALRKFGQVQPQGDIRQSLQPAETISLIPPAEGGEEVDREITLGDGCTISVTSRMLGALRSYVQEYVRVYGRARFVADFYISPVVLLRWEEGHTGFMIPVRVLDRIGTEPDKIMAATGDLHNMDSEDRPGTDEDTWYDPGDGWEIQSRDETPRVVSVRSLVPDEVAAYGADVAHLMFRWRNLRDRVYDSDKFWYDELTTEQSLLFLVTLLEVEIELLRHRMAIMGGGSRHPLDRAMWDEEGFSSEIAWREVKLADARRLLAHERRPWFRRVLDWLLP